MTDPRSTGSATIADLLLLAADRAPGAPALRSKRDGTWVDTTYGELGTTVSEIARGLIDLGLAAGDRVALLANTRPEWTACDFAITSAGGVVVPIYPTNSPEECAWVAGDSGARMIICEDAGQAAKIAQVRDRLPDLGQVIVMDELGALRERGRARDAEEVAQRARAVTREDPYTIIYTSGTTGPPKGCVLSHGNYRSVLDMCYERGMEGIGEGGLVYLFLPLAHAYALLIQLLCIDIGVTLAYFGGDTTKIIEELAEVHPTYLPSVPRIFEKLYAMVAGALDAQTIARATEVGMKVRLGEAEPDAEFEALDAGLFARVRAAFGGRLHQAATGAAPIAKEILEFFYAAGIPILEGYGMTETSTVATRQTVDDFKFGTVGKPLPGCELRIADDGEVLLRGPNIFGGYYKQADTSAFGAVDDGWLHTGDLGSIDADGFLSITGRKKDIIITAGGKNIAPALLENELKQSPLISQAVMYGDRRPYPVALITLDPDAGLDPASEDARAQVQAVVDEVNSHYAQVEQIKRFAILPRDLSMESGELTPTLKVKRNVVYDAYADVFDGLYA